jgi:hypothetical protein
MRKVRRQTIEVLLSGRLGLTRKYKIATKNIPETNNLAYLTLLSVMKIKV